MHEVFQHFLKDFLKIAQTRGANLVSNWFLFIFSFNNSPLVPRRFIDGHISDGHFLDGQILDRAISGTLFRQVKRMGHFSDRTMLAYDVITTS